MVLKSGTQTFGITFTMLQFTIGIILSLSVATTSGLIVTTSKAPTSKSLWRLHTEKTKPNDCCNFRRHGGWCNPEIFRLNAQNESQEIGAESLRAQAEALKAKADELRSEINENKSSSNANKNKMDTATNNESTSATTSLSPWALPSTEPRDEGDRELRLYVDIGREEGTWMDPRWGASGNRIEFSLDVGLLVNRLADPEIAKRMVKDNNMGKSSQVFALETAEFARLRDGYDRMKCSGGAYRIDTNRNGRSTIRFVIEVEGTVRADQSYYYGDISIPAGILYFSLPCFGRGINNLSTKEGVVSVRQVGWHTGWRREESRIAGVFRAKPLSEAKKRDPF